MLRRLLFASLCVIAIAAPAAASAGVQQALFCHPMNDAHPYGASQYGIHNGSSTAELTVFCPLGTLNGVRSASITGYPRNPNTPISCTLFRTDMYGTITGWTALSSLAAPANVQPNSPAVTQSDLNIYHPYSDYQYIACTIPRAFNGGFSYLTTIRTSDCQNFGC